MTHTPDLSIYNIGKMISYFEIAGKYYPSMERWKCMLNITGAYISIFKGTPYDLSIHISNTEAFYYYKDILVCNTSDNRIHHLFCSDPWPITAVKDSLRAGLDTLQYLTLGEFNTIADNIYAEMGIKIRRIISYDF